VWDDSGSVFSCQMARKVIFALFSSRAALTAATVRSLHRSPPRLHVVVEWRILSRFLFGSFPPHCLLEARVSSSANVAPSAPPRYLSSSFTAISPGMCSRQNGGMDCLVFYATSPYQAGYRSLRSVSEIGRPVVFLIEYSWCFRVPASTRRGRRVS